MQSSITKARSKPRNVLRGIIPIISGFDTNPTNLANATDENPATATGIGVKTVSATGPAGQYVFDLGPNFKPCMVGFGFGFYTTAGTITPTVDQSDDGLSFGGVIPLTTTSATIEVIRPCSPVFVFKRYVRLWMNAGAAATISSRLYEVVGY